MNPISSTPSLSENNLLQNETSIENSKVRSIFERINKTWISFGNIPGPMAFFTIPWEVITAARALSHSQVSGDEEAMQDALMKLAGLPTYFLYSALTLSQVIIQIGLFLGIFQASQHSHFVPKAVLLTAIAGVVFCGIEGSASIWSFIKQQKFINTLPNKAVYSIEYFEIFPEKKREYIQKSALKDLDFFTQYLEKVSEETEKLAKKTFKDPKKAKQFLESFQEAKLAQLSKKVMPWFAEKVAKELPFILDKIKSKDIATQKEGILEGRKLLADAKCQAQKQRIKQALSMIAIGLTLSGCLGVFGIGILYFGWVPIGVFGLSFGVYLLNYTFSSGTLYHEGWEFRAKECIPRFLLNFFIKPSPRSQ